MKIAIKLSFCCLLSLSSGCGAGGQAQTEIDADDKTSQGQTEGGSDGKYARATEPPPVVVEDLHDPTSAEPVSTGVAVVPSQVRPGETVSLVVTAKIAPSWHIYAIDKPVGVAKPTSLQLTLPEGVVPEGKWQIPEAHEFKAGGQTADGPTFVYDGEVSFYRQLKVSPESKGGQLDITCEFGYMACDDSTCRPPKVLPIPASIDVLQ